MKNTFVKFAFLLGCISSSPAFADEYDNYYVQYMYENYVGKRRARPVEFDILEQNLKENKNIQMPQVIDEKDLGNTDTKQTYHLDFDTRFYLQLNAGVSQLNKYKLNFANYSLNKAKMENDTNEFSYGLSLGWAFENWNVEIEANKVKYGKVETSDINKTFLIEYNNKLDIMDLGGNITYNILNPKTNRLVPFVGVGLGYSIFKIADFGQVWAKDGVPVEAGTEGAVATNFESGYEETNPWYAKVMAGLNIAVSDRVNLLVSVDYKMYEDITTDNNLEFSDINSLKIFILSLNKNKTKPKNTKAYAQDTAIPNPSLELR